MRARWRAGVHAKLESLDTCDAASINERSDEVAHELNVQAALRFAYAEQRLAAGLFNTNFQIGGAILVAVVPAVISVRTAPVGGKAQPRLPRRVRARRRI